MPAKPRLSARPSPPATSTSHPKTTAPPLLAFGDCDDDDDDLLIPPHARPLKPSNVAASRRPRKKLELSSSCSGKGNRSVFGGTAPAERVVAMAAEAAETLAVGSWASAGVPDDKEATGGGICGLLGSVSDGPKISADGKKGFGGYGDCKGSSSYRPNSTESRVLEPVATCDLGGGYCEEAEEVGSRACTAVPEEGVEVGRSESDPSSMEKELNGSGPREGHYYSRSIEPRLPELSPKCKFGGVGLKDEEELGSGVHGSASDEGNVDTEAGVASRSETNNNEGSGFGGNYYLNSIESKLLVSNAKYDFGGGDCKEPKDPGLGICSLVSEERKVVAEDVATLKFETREEKSSRTEDCKRSRCSNSVESALLESHRIH